MKNKIFIICIFANFPICTLAQNVGIGTATPTLGKLHVVGTGTGIYGDGPNTGIHGIGTTYGLRGFSNSGRGVYGSSTTGYGVYGQGGSYGVYANGSEYGVYGAGGPYGIFGSGNTYGVYGVSTIGNGVYGIGGPTGVYGSGSNYGVNGVSNYIGVKGSSSGYVGVFGEGGPTGVYGSGTDYGVYGNASSGSGIGVYGNNINYVGIWGNGVYGALGTGTAYGTSGQSVNGYGVWGLSTNNYGVYGQSTNNRGGQFYSQTNQGLWAKTDALVTAGFYAGVFEGAVYTYLYYQSSDKNLKKNIQDVGDAMSIINQLKPKNYEFRNDGKYAAMNLPKGNHYGLIAQELEEILPDLVANAPHGLGAPIPKPRISSDSTKINVVAQQNETKELLGLKAINYIELIPILIKGMQEQQKQIDTLIKELQLIKGKRK